MYTPVTPEEGSVCFPRIPPLLCILVTRMSKENLKTSVFPTVGWCFSWPQSTQLSPSPQPGECQLVQSYARLLPCTHTSSLPFFSLLHFTLLLPFIITVLDKVFVKISCLVQHSQLTLLLCFNICLYFQAFEEADSDDWGSSGFRQILTSLKVQQSEWGTLTGWRNGLIGTLHSSTRRKYKDLQLRKNNYMHEYMLVASWLESSIAEHDLGVLVDTKLNMS